MFFSVFYIIGGRVGVWVRSKCVILHNFFLNPSLTHTMDNHILCGGTTKTSSCLYYEAGNWTNYGKDLKGRRSLHVSWRRPDGQVILMGGPPPSTSSIFAGGSKGNEKSSEVVSSSGTQKGFDLKHEV